MSKKRLWWMLGVGVGIVIICTILILIFGCSIWGHMYELYTVESTCTDEGRIINTCKLCGDNYEDLLPANGHRYKEEDISPTCTEQGYTLNICSVCGHQYRSDYVDATHKYEQTSILKAVTCTESGLAEYTCSNCGDMYSEKIWPKGHSFVTKRNIAATCTGRGIYTGECSKCGEKKEEITPAIGHDWWGDTCDNCGNVNPEYIWKKLVNSNGKTLIKVYVHSGELSIVCTYQGTGNFYIKILDENQDFVKLVCNEIGSYVVDTTVKLSSGWYYIDIACTRGTYTWTMSGIYWEYSLAKNAIKDYRNAHPDEICNCYDLMNYFFELGIPDDAIDAVDIFGNVPEGYFDGTAFESDEARTEYFIKEGFSREAIIKWYVDCGYSTKKATDLVDKCMGN